MHDPLNRLYKTKIALLAVLLIFPGVALMVYGASLEHLSIWPEVVLGIGGGMFTTGLLGVGWQYFDGKDSEARDTERLRRVLAESAPAMREAVIKGFAFEPADLARVATPETLDKIVTNGLGIRLGDQAFAEEIYDDLKRQAIGIPERLHDVRVNIRLSPLPMGRGTPFGRACFVATVRWEYQTVPAYKTRRFAATADVQDFRDLSHEAGGTSAWYIGKRTGLDAASEDTFVLVDFSVDGQPRKISRTVKRGGQTYSVHLGDDAMDSGKSVTLAYTYRTLIAADQNLLQLRVDQPTKGLSMELDYGDVGLEFVNVLDFIASSDRTTITRSAESLPGKTVQVEFDGWVFARSGVAFVWRNRDSSLRATRQGR